MSSGSVGNVATINRRAFTPGTLTIEWTIGATTYTLTDDGAGGLIGNGSGTVNYSWGSVSFKPNPAPRPSDGNYTIAYDRYSGSAKVTDSVTPTQSSISHTLAGGECKAGSLVIKAKMSRLQEYIDYATYGPGANSDEARTYEVDVLVRDDGDGNLLRDGVTIGTVNYATGELVFDFRQAYTYTDLEESGGSGPTLFREWSAGEVAATESYVVTTDVAFFYQASTDPDAAETKYIPIDGVTMDLIPGNGKPIIPGSLLFTWGGKTYRDREGSIVTDWSSTTDAGSNVGSIDYASGVVTLNDWAAGVNLTTAPVLLACLTWRGERTTNYSKFRTAGAPLRQGSLILNAVTEEGAEVSVTAATDGTITHAKISDGFVDTDTGIVTITWSEPVFPTSVKYSAVAYSYLPLDPDLLGLDPTRLPSDGRVPVFLPGDVGVFSHTIETEEVGAAADGTVTFTRDHQAEVWVKGTNGLTLDPAQYSLDREAGVLTWANPLTLETIDEEAVTTPLFIYDRIEDMVLITDVQVSGVIGFNSPLSQDYPDGEAVLCSAILHGDLRARVYNLFHQSGWTSVWSDERIGSDTTAKYNDIAFPLEINNQGSIKERWRISFTSSSAFQVIGETVGVIGTGNTSADCAIANPATGAPYFTIRQEGWGSGWASGNQVRFNTDGAQSPFWLARTVLSGPATAEEDSFATQNRGDAD